MKNRIGVQIEKIVQDFRSKGFPCAHWYGGEMSTSGVVKIIEVVAKPSFVGHSDGFAA